ncbi:MAG: glutamyl-tRNA reductase [Blautia sp.]|nr:glutamyl-tRNA reductase [Blautia sp.]
MSISMIGIDHNAALLDIRALYSFTKKEAGEAMLQLKKMQGIQGCLILSTCNRTEIWISKDDTEISLYELLCQVKNIRKPEYRRLFVERRDRDAVEHLFCLTGGLKSQILGEDQILKQVKDALSLARENFVTDNVIEVLFRMAVTVGKRIKTEVSVPHGNVSVIHEVIKRLERDDYRIRGKKCLVIGNGEMGKIAAQTLQEQGADVTVTVRQYHSGVIHIPTGCRRIDYGERWNLLPDCDLVVSATASPNYTLTKSAFRNLQLQKPLLLIDLAVPRDIEPDLCDAFSGTSYAWDKNVPFITLLDMDSFRIEGQDELVLECIENAKYIIEEQMQAFYDWMDCRDVVPRIQWIQEEAVRDLNARLEKVFRKMPLDEHDRDVLSDAVNTAAGKVINKLLFGLRDSLNTHTFQECVTGLEKLYEE